MHAGLFDVLHDAADVELGAVVERVDVDLDRVVEEAVDEERMRRADDALALDAREVVGEVGRVVDDLHAAAAEHEARTHEHGGVADALATWTAVARSVAVPFLGARRPAASRIPENWPRSSARSIASGVVPRIGTPAASRPFASPSAVWPPSCTMTPTSSPDCDSAWMTSSTSSSVSGSK